MKKIIVTFSVVVIIGVLLLVIASMYTFDDSTAQPGYDTNSNQIDATELSSSPQNVTYTIDGEAVTLVDGSSEKEAAPGSAAKVSTNYFGNEVKSDLNGDGREDQVFLLTQSTGGTGTFFYVVAALSTEAGWIGSHGYLLGDRAVPQTTQESQNPSHQNVIVVNYMERATDQAMSSERPSVGKSVWLKLDTQTMVFGEVEQDFSGEANPDTMTLQMKPWTWVQTTYNNDTQLMPRDDGAFTLTFAADGTFSASTDCNAMGGQYELDKNEITFNNIVATEMYCEGSQEQEFIAILNETQSYFFTPKGELVFDLKYDTGSSVFR